MDLSFSGFPINFSLVGGPQKTEQSNFSDFDLMNSYFFHLAG